MYNEHYSLADRWRYAVRCDAKVRSHLQPIHFRDIENRSINAGDYNKWNKPLYHEIYSALISNAN